MAAYSRERAWFSPCMLCSAGECDLADPEACRHHRYAALYTAGQTAQGLSRRHTGSLHWLYTPWRALHRS